MNRQQRRAIADDYQWALDHYRRRGAGVPISWATGDAPPVLLLAGVFEPWSFLLEIGNGINRAGFPVHVAEAVGRNRDPIFLGAERALRYLTDHDLRHVRIVAHSKGGLVGKQVMALDPDDRVDRLVAIATPFGGSVRARRMPVRALRSLSPENAEIAALVARDDLNTRITSVHAAWDAHIPNGNGLVGGRNIELPLLGHFTLLSNPLVIDTVLAELRS